MKKKYDIITALDLCVDFIVSCGNVIPQFNQIEQMIESYELELGGSCCIFATQASRLGLNVAGVGSVGEDHFGKFILDQLKSNKVDISHIRIAKNIKTGVGIILNRHTDRAILTYSGSIDGADKSHFTDELIQQTKHLHIGSYFLLQKLRPCLKEILINCRSLGITTSLDTNWDPENKWDGGLSEILPLINIFLPNENEALLISGKNHLEEAIEWLQKRIEIVVIKMGEKGAICCKGDYRKHLPSLNVSVVDTVGAGDSFDAGFVYGFINGYSPDKCLKTGIICGSLSTRKPGGIRGQGFISEIMNLMDGQS